MPSVEAQVAALAGMLAIATGSHPRETRGDGRIRIEADLPAELTPTTRSAILAALGSADSYGHTRTASTEFVWAEIPWDRS